MHLLEAERLIEASADHRLLRRVPPANAWPLSTGTDLRRAVFVDTETTGLDPDTDEVIELALLPFDYDRDTGEIVHVDLANAYNGLQQPSLPIPPETTAVHGITDADVAGKSIDPEACADALPTRISSSRTTLPWIVQWLRNTGPNSRKSTGRALWWKSIGKRKALAPQSLTTYSSAKVGFTMATAHSLTLKPRRFC